MYMYNDLQSAEVRAAVGGGTASQVRKEAEGDG